MTTCKNCGKSEWLLNLNACGLCAECSELKKAVPSRSTIVVNSREINVGDINRTVDHSDEEEVCDFFIRELVKAGFSRDKFKIEHRTKEYTSLFYALEDIVRIKITANVKWISIPLLDEDRDKPDIKAMFEKETLKFRHCKSYFESINDIVRYVNYISVLKPVEYYGVNRRLTEKENEAVAYAYNLMTSLGAGPDDFYLYILSKEVELIYKSWHCTVRYHLYKKKKGGRFSYRTSNNSIVEETFTELADIQNYKNELIKTIKYADDEKFAFDMSGYLKYKGIDSSKDGKETY